jgi:acylphosphatase
MTKEENMKNVRAQIVVSGLVQGVFFRSFAAKKAKELDLVGFVMNKSDGTVLIVAEGEKLEIEKLIAVVKDGPDSADVDNVAVDWQKATDEFDEFGIEFGEDL